MLRRSLLPSGRPSAPARRVSESLGIRNSPLKRVHSSKPHLDKAKAPPLPISLASGGFAGLISALTGVGGGIILIPALARLTSLTQQTINGTSHGATVFSACIALMTGPAILCSKLGVQAAQKMSSKKLSFIVGVAMLACAPLVYLKNNEYLQKRRSEIVRDKLDITFFTSDTKGSHRQEGAVDWKDLKENKLETLRANAKYLVAGAGAGFVSGLCGMGGGMLLSAYLTAASDMPQEAVIGTSLLSIVPTAGASALYNIKAKAFHLPTAVTLGGALVVSMYATSKFVTHQIPDEHLRGVLSGTLMLAGISLILRG